MIRNVATYTLEVDESNRIVRAWDKDGNPVMPYHKARGKSEIWTQCSLVNYRTQLCRMKKGTGEFRRVKDSRN